MTVYRVTVTHVTQEEKWNTATFLRKEEAYKVADLFKAVTARDVDHQPYCNNKKSRRFDRCCGGRHLWNVSVDAEE